MFDVAGSVLLIDCEDGREVSRQERRLSSIDLAVRAGEFLTFGASVLLCGAISAPLESLLAASGVRVIGFLCGPVDDVVAAFLSGTPAPPQLWMPGCGGWRKRWGSGRRMEMPRGFGMGSGRGGGRGRGAGAGGRGKMGGPAAAGTGGGCVCPSCGERTPHTPGQPCKQTRCPKCGTPMTRG